MAVWYCLLATYWLASVLAADQQSFSPQVDNVDKARQLLYVPQSPQLQRLELVDENSDAQYLQPNIQNRGAQSFNIRVSDPNEGQGASKIESLEPDAEIIPGAQTPPQAQIPVASPGAGIPGLLPGQQVYIVHPQHQLFMNPLYPGIPNGFRPNVQLQGVPGYQQRFYIVQPQPTNDGSYAAPVGYQNTILVDPSSGQPIPPQYLQPNHQQQLQPNYQQQLQPNYHQQLQPSYQQLISQNPLQSRFPAAFPYQPQQVQENRYQEKAQNAQEQLKENSQQNKIQQEQLKANQQISNAQPQFLREPEQIDASYIPLRRPDQFPYHQLFLGGGPFTPPFFLQQRGQYNAGVDRPQYAAATSTIPEQGGFVPIGSATGKIPQQAQGRNDYSVEETKEFSKDVKSDEKSKKEQQEKADEPKDLELNESVGGNADNTTVANH